MPVKMVFKCTSSAEAHRGYPPGRFENHRPCLARVASDRIVWLDGGDMHRAIFLLVVLLGCGGLTDAAPDLPPPCNLHDHCGEICVGERLSATSWRAACQCPGAPEVPPLWTTCEVCGEDNTCACIQGSDTTLQKWRCSDTATGPVFEAP